MNAPVTHEVTLELDDLYEGINGDSNVWVDTTSGIPILTRTEDFGHSLAKFDKAVRAMISSKELFYTFGRNRYGNLICKKTELSKYFYLLKRFRDFYKADCIFGESIMLFFETAHSLGMWDENFTSPEARSWVVGKNQAELCNDLVEAIQKQGNTKEFKKRLSARTEKATTNFKAAMAYEKAMFGWRSKLLVLRIDFGYQAKYGERLTIAEARNDFAHFLNNRRKNSTIFSRMGGYIWKLEYGSEGKGFHFHLIFFFDGAKAQKDAYIADQIGQYWVNTITKGRGNYHNCNQDKRKYKHLGIGMIHRDDLEMRNNLGIAIQYLTKKDYCLKLGMDKGRVFGKGANPPKNLTGVGRPLIKLAGLTTENRVALLASQSPE